MMFLIRLWKTKRRILMIGVAAIIAAAVLSASLIFSILLAASLPDISVAREAALKTPYAKRLSEALELAEGFTKIAEKSGVSLLFNKTEQTFMLQSDDGRVWYSGYPNDRLETLENLSSRDRRRMTTLLSLSYMEAGGREASVTDKTTGVEVSYKKLENGLEVVFDFPEQKLSASLQIWLSDGGFYVSVPDDSLKEDPTVCSLMSINVLPTCGSMLSGENGYMLYPDGCGSLFDCKTAQGKTGLFSGYVYAEQFAVPAESSEAPRILWPWFGSVRSSESGYIGYVIRGGHSTSISLSASGARLGNQLYASAIYRYPIRITNSRDKDFVVLGDKVKNLDFCISYRLLSGETANYSGAAVELRHMMTELGVLPKKKVTNQLPLALDVLMNVKQNGLLGESDLSMTTWAEAETQLEQLKTLGVEESYVVLLGWQREGWGGYPLSSKPAAALGSRKTASRLLDGDDRKVFLQSDYARANADGHVNLNRDVTYNGVAGAVTDLSEKQYLLNPLVAFQRFIKDLKNYQRLGSRGLAFDSLSDVLPADSSKNREVSAGDAKDLYAAMLKGSQEQGLLTATQAGGDYLLRYSDYIYNLPDSGSNSLFFTREVPMLQMVLHGILPYSGATPGNISPDFEVQRLKWVEYGCLPYFLVSQQSAAELKQTDTEDIYNSRFSDWKALIAETSVDFSKRLAPVADARITAHTQLYDGVAKVDYENGYTVYINYKKESASVPGGTVPARDFAVVSTNGGVS